MRLKHALAIACGASLAGAVPIAPAIAGTLQINPVLLEINSGHRTATVTLRNEEAAPVTVRAYALDWQQADGEDRYADTSAVIVSPPVFTIAPGATQLIRVGQRSQSGGPHAYRLILEEVPDASPTGGIRVALRLNVPLYAAIGAADAGTLGWSATRGPDGSWMLEATNRGSGYVRLNPAAVQAATGLRLGQVVFGTVLPGAVRRWRIGSNPDVGDQTRFRQIARIQDHVGAQASRD